MRSKGRAQELEARRRLAVQRVTDGGPNHKGPTVQDFLRRNKRLTLERLPALRPGSQPGRAGVIVAQVQAVG